MRPVNLMRPVQPGVSVIANLQIKYLLEVEKTESDQSASFASTSIGLVARLRSYFEAPSVTLAAGDYYTFGTICYTCLIIDVNYRATFLTRVACTWGGGIRNC